MVMKNNNIAITSDLHVDGQFGSGIVNLVEKYGKLTDFDVYIAGDMAPFTKDGWHEDPGYAAKKAVRAELAKRDVAPEEITRRANQAQKDAWTTHRDEMVQYSLRTLELSKTFIKTLVENVRLGIINPIIDVPGNSTAIISDYQNRALEIVGKTEEHTIEDMIKLNSPSIRRDDSVTMERYGSALVVTIPYSEHIRKQGLYMEQIENIPQFEGIKDVYVIYHENRFPELVGYKGKPVVMKDCLDQSLDVIKTYFPDATVNEIVGHNHVIPEKKDYKIKTEDNTFIVPVGVDNKKMIARILVGSGDKETLIDYHV